MDRNVKAVDQTRKGHLKIFFSYAESIGKTLAMLKDAGRARSQGMDVVAGYIAPDISREALALLEEIQRLEPGPIDIYDDGKSRRQSPEAVCGHGKPGQPDFDLDRALERRPDLILVDELAHSNPPGSRHRRRYQDIQELLQAGIDVYTTVNVGNLESLHDTVTAITGITAWDRIPDSVFDRADQVELIDIEPQELLKRLKESDTADSRLTLQQLTALREVALRRCADRVKRLAGPGQERGFHTDEHILVCLSSAPSNARIIRTAARMAGAFSSQFTALFVETPDFKVASAEDRQRLRDNQSLAEQLGARIETVYGEDVAYQIAEFARLSGITRIVLGQSSVVRKYPAGQGTASGRHLAGEGLFSRKRLFGKMPLTEQLISYVPEMDIHIIPDQGTDSAYHPRKAGTCRLSDIPGNTAWSVCILSGATLLSLGFYRLGFTEANIIMVYILGVLLTSTVTSHQIYSLVSSIASVFIFNFLFTHPRFSLTAYETGYPVTFVVMFLTAYITGTFAIRYKEQAGQSARVAHRTKILFDTDQLLSRAGSREEILCATAQQVMKLLNRNLVIFENLDGQLSAPRLFRPGAQTQYDGHADREYARRMAGNPGTDGTEHHLNSAVGRAAKQTAEFSYDLEKEGPTAQWVLHNNHVAGATTDTLSDSRYLYLALRVNERVYGVLGIEAKHRPLEAQEYDILLSILGECALALENEKNVREKEAAAVLAESEQLRANLLRTISHDLRTPLTTISGNASNLLNHGSSFDEETRRQIYSDIYDDSMWLISLVENLLYATRIEEGRMALHTSPELLGDLVEEAMKHISRKAEEHHLSVVSDQELLLVKADARLVVQVIVNLVDNAVKYTEPGSTVTVTTRACGEMAEVSVADNGGGIPDQEKEKVFEKFYCGTRKIADNRRSLGLGLFLCKAIVEAHGGTIQVADNQPQGTLFRFFLPLEEVTFYE